MFNPRLHNVTGDFYIYTSVSLLSEKYNKGILNWNVDPYPSFDCTPILPPNFPTLVSIQYQGFQYSSKAIRIQVYINESCTIILIFYSLLFLHYAASLML